MGTRHLILVRHGAYYQAPEHPRYGSLTAAGREEARAVGRALADVSVRSVVASSMPRAIETAEVIAATIGASRTRRLACLSEVVPDLSAGDLGSQALRSDGDAAATRADLQRQPNRRREHLRAVDPTGERLAAHDQACEAWRRLVRPVRTGDVPEIVVMHGNLIRWLACRAMGAETALWSNLGTAYGGITRLRVASDGSATLDSYNETGHLTAVDRRTTYDPT